MTITNLDPEPYVDDRGNRYVEPVTLRQTREMTYAPRPEFDVGDNPILEALAKDAAEYNTSISDEADIYAGYAEWGFDGIGDATPEQIDHARTVLELIAKAA